MKAENATLQLIKVGCPGETSTTMTSGGGPCQKSAAVPAGYIVSQLVDAVALILPTLAGAAGPKTTKAGMTYYDPLLGLALQAGLQRDRRIVRKGVEALPPPLIGTIDRNHRPDQCCLEFSAAWDSVPLGIQCCFGFSAAG